MKRKLRRHSPWKFGLVLGLGALVAVVLCVQCVRTYWYTDDVLVPQGAEREAERQVGALATAARSAGITDPHALGPVIERALESAGDRVLWMRVLDPASHLLAQGGRPQGTAKVPLHWWEKVEKHENLGFLVDTPVGKALVAMLPFRMPRLPPPRLPEGSPEAPSDFRSRPPGRPIAYVIEVAIPLNAVAGASRGFVKI
jgi:hypothetical protein